jgi:hypothetical protein
MLRIWRWANRASPMHHMHRLCSWHIALRRAWCAHGNCLFSK